MMALIFFLAGCAVIWHGLDVGGLAGFGYMALGVVGWLFAVASATMGGEPIRSSRRPPTNPPGYKNIKIKKGQ